MGKKILTFLFTIILLFSFTSCHMVFVDENKDLAQVVATVNGVNITKGDVMALYNTYRDQNKLTPENQTTERYIDTYHSILKEAYNKLIEYQLILQYGSEYAPVELTDDMRESVNKSVENVTTSETSSVKNEVEEEAANDSTVNVDEEVSARLATRLKYRGISTGEYQNRLEMEAIIEKVGDAIRAGYQPTEEDIQTYYNDEMESQKELIAQDISYYDYFQSYYINLYVPDGFRYAKNLLIALPDDIQEKISTFRENGDDTAADALANEELAKISGTAQEIYNRIQNGEDYNTLLAQYGEDPGMKAGEYYAETGYRLYEGMSGYDEKFVAAAFALKNPGDVSVPIASDYGYYIIQYVSVSTAHAVPLEDVRDKVEEELVSRKSQDLYDEVIESWKREAVITEHSDLLYQ